MGSSDSESDSGDENDCDWLDEGSDGSDSGDSEGMSDVSDGSDASESDGACDIEAERYQGRNCYDGHGGKNVDLKHDNENPKHMSVADATRLCEKKGYAGFTYRNGRMWRLQSVDKPNEFKISKDCDVYVIKRRDVKAK